MLSGADGDGAIGQLTADAQQVLRSLVPIEREMRADSRWLLARVLSLEAIDLHSAVVSAGVGVEPAAAEGIFRVFEQETGDVTLRYGGLGLGWPSPSPASRRTVAAFAQSARGPGPALASSSICPC